MQRGVWIPMSEGLPEMKDRGDGILESESIIIECPYWGGLTFVDFKQFGPDSEVFVIDESGDSYYPKDIKYYLYIPEIPKD